MASKKPKKPRQPVQAKATARRSPVSHVAKHANRTARKKR